MKRKILTVAAIYVGLWACIGVVLGMKHVAGEPIFWGGMTAAVVAIHVIWVMVSPFAIMDIIEAEAKRRRAGIC